ncbi:MAG TPA: SDR family NAD(P)-dependent oxidoreductase [Methylomirabilota bacterium]
MLAGRVALVTGASAGIGEATARARAAAGMRVAVCARRRERLDRLAAGIRSAGGEVAVYGLDVIDAGAVRAMVNDVASRWERIDVLVNNAGRGLSATVEDTKPDEFRALLELNVMAVFTATQAVLPWMRRQGRGHIINVSSIVGRRGVPYRGAYSATKFALGGLSESLRVELAGTGISVSLVYPIGTATEFHEAEARRAGPGPLGPIQSAEHVARCILRCVRRPRPEVYPFRPSRMLAIASVIAPRLADLGLRRLLR